jgi:hypothetical protein
MCLACLEKSVSATRHDGVRINLKAPIESQAIIITVSRHSSFLLCCALIYASIHPVRRPNIQQRESLLASSSYDYAAVHYREEGIASHAAASHSNLNSHSRCISLCIISARIHCNAWLNGSSPPPRPFTARTCISPSCLASFVGTTVSGDSSCCIPSLNGWRSRSFRTRSFASCSFWYKVCCLIYVLRLTREWISVSKHEKVGLGRSDSIIHLFNCLAQWLGIRVPTPCLSFFFTHRHPHPLSLSSFTAPLSFLADYCHMTKDSTWHVYDRLMACISMILQIWKIVELWRHHTRIPFLVLYSLLLVLAVTCFGQSQAAQLSQDQEQFVLWHNLWHL